MKKLFAFLLIGMIILFSGCSTMENKMDAVEETLEQKVNQAANALLNPNAPTQGQSLADPTSFISPEEAQQIALDHAGMSAETVVGLHTLLQIDDGRQEYEVTFRSGHLEYEYEIDPISGTILSVDVDD